MSRTELYEHLVYWQDDVKIAAYSAALEEVISPGDRVLDLGAGTGLLGILAARAGAGEIWSYDAGPILGVARDIARKNGVADRINFVQEFTTRAELPEVDIIVCDQIGGLVYDAGILEFYADASRRALRPGGTLMPSSFEVFLAPVQAPQSYKNVDGWETSLDVDLEPIQTIAANTEYRIGPEDVSLLSDGQAFATMTSDDASNFGSRLTFAAAHSGMLHGLLGWFNAQMSPSVSLTNSPIAAQRMDRWLNFYPLQAPIEVEAGQPIDVTIDIRPAGYMARWDVAVADHPVQRMSTFQGTFMFDRISGFDADGPLKHPDERAAVATELLGLAASGASSNELTKQAMSHSALFPTEEAAKRFARRVRSLLEA